MMTIGHLRESLCCNVVQWFGWLFVCAIRIIQSMPEISI